MSSTKWTQIERIQLQYTKYYNAKYIHAHQVLTISYSSPLDSIEDLFLDDNRTAIAPGAASVIKGTIIKMVDQSIAPDIGASTNMPLQFLLPHGDEADFSVEQVVQNRYKTWVCHTCCISFHPPLVPSPLYQPWD